MLGRLFRLAVIQGHLAPCRPNRNLASSLNHQSEAVMTITPTRCLVDEKITIKLSGLKPKQLITLLVEVTENNCRFESRCLYEADNNGEINNCSSSSLAGSFKGVDQMGLFWSIKSNEEYIRFFKKDVTSPMLFHVKAFQGDRTGKNALTNDHLLEGRIERSFMRSGVKRIPLKTGKVRGTLFIPEGDGPFPALTDMFGGLVSLIETRAALLASHGYAVLALQYLYGEGLPQSQMEVDIEYLLDSYRWFSEQPYVDKNRLGAIGLCYGGLLSLVMAYYIPQIKVVVNINGLAVIPKKSKIFTPDRSSDFLWVDDDVKQRVYTTDEGIVIGSVTDISQTRAIPAWIHGVKALIISGEDDYQIHPKYHHSFLEQWPEELKHNVEFVSYPGAGHLIEQPYLPHCRSSKPGKQRLAALQFIPDEFHDLPLMIGGFPKEHALAQEQSWEKILEFLDTNLKSRNIT